MNHKNIIKLSLVFIGGAFIGIAIGWFLWSPIKYYEYDAVTAEECLDGESFDEEYDVCYFDFYCESEVECAMIDAQYGQVLQSFADQYREDSPEHKTYGLIVPITDEEIDTPEPVNELAIEESTLAVQSDSLELNSVEDLLKFLLPDDRRSMIHSVIADSDGYDGVVAYVEPLDNFGAQWQLAYDPKDTFSRSGAYIDIEEFLPTLIHEYAHILTLDNSQVVYAQPDVEYIECSVNQIVVDEGCASQSSYVHTFALKFWSEQDRDDASYALYDGDEDYAYRLFSERPTDFVTEYAATNEAEDIAESFALFILEDRPTMSTLADQKILFFYDYPELVDLRNHMRGGAANLVHLLK